MYGLYEINNAFVIIIFLFCVNIRNKRAYVSLVRPIAEYATTAWSPSTIKLINCVEGIQRRAAHFVCHDYRRDSSVSAMIDQLGWQSLQKRRVENDLYIFYLFYKIHNKKVDIPFPPELTSIVSSRTRGHKQRLRHVGASVDPYKHSFFIRTIPSWNSLLTPVIEADSLPASRWESA